MEEYKVTQTSATSADVHKDIILKEANTVRRLFRAEIVRKPDSREWLIKGRFIHQRKKPGEVWEDSEMIDLNTLKAGEGVKISLDSEQMQRLFEGLDQLKAVAGKMGIRVGTQEYAVAKKGEFIAVKDDKNRELIQQLVDKNYGDEFWKTLAQSKPDIARRLSYSQVHMDREAALREFQKHLKANDWKEPDWEGFFQSHQWIFGYGLRYQFLGIERNQANYGGADYTRKGEQKGEFLAKTMGQTKFTVLVEIKRPDTLFFDAKQQYRSGVPVFNPELLQAVSQVQVNSRTWDTEGSRTDSNRDILQQKGVSTINPRGILVFGNTEQFSSDLVKRQAFELFRTHLRHPEIITFDELYERARFIVEDEEHLN